MEQEWLVNEYELIAWIMNYRLRKEAEMTIAASKAEMEREMCLQRDQFMHDIQEARNQLVSLY